MSPATCDGIRTDSAGFIGPGRESPPEAINAALERSVDLSEHRSKVLDEVSLESVDVIFVMDSGQRSKVRRRVPEATVLVLGDLDSVRADRRRIRDPVMQPIEVFRAVYDRIDRCVNTVADQFDVKEAISE